MPPSGDILLPVHTVSSGSVRVTWRFTATFSSFGTHPPDSSYHLEAILPAMRGVFGSREDANRKSAPFVSRGGGAWDRKTGWQPSPSLHNKPPVAAFPAKKSIYETTNSPTRCMRNAQGITRSKSAAHRYMGSLNARYVGSPTRRRDARSNPVVRANRSIVSGVLAQ